MLSITYPSSLDVEFELAVNKQNLITYVCTLVF